MGLAFLWIFYANLQIQHTYSTIFHLKNQEKFRQNPPSCIFSCIAKKNMVK